MTTRRSVLQAAAIQGLAGCFGSAFARSQPKETPAKATTHGRSAVHADERINRLLAPVRDKHRVPGLVGAILSKGQLLAGAVGVRKLGSPEPIQVTDRMHLGSNTKAMTATLLGTLVDEGKLSWESTIRDVFPDLAPQLHPECRAVTLSQLLTHRSGIPGNFDDKPTLQDALRMIRLTAAVREGRTATEQRRSLMKAIMKDPPKNKPGSTFDYSNHGYMLAALMAEQITGQSWETLMTVRLFEPLGMFSAGFGPPGRPGEVDQPWGHLRSGAQLRPTQEDRIMVPIARPAGAVHCSIPDWSKFAALHLAAARGEAKLLKLSTFRFLQTAPPGFSYAGGWHVVVPPGTRDRVLIHDGTNTAWWSFLALVPSQNAAILLATNQGDGIAENALQDAVDALTRLPDLPADVFAPP